MENNNQCMECGAPLTKKEMLTLSLNGSALCDLCMGKQRRLELAKTSYQQKLSSVPAAYNATKYGDKILAEYYGKSAVIIGEESPITGTQWLWDTIRYYWRNGQNAMYVSIKDLTIEYTSLPWQQKMQYMESYMEMPGMLAIDDIDHDIAKDLLSRIVEHRAERDLNTLIVIHVAYDDLDRIIGDKATDLIKSRWKSLSMERS